MADHSKPNTAGTDSYSSTLSALMARIDDLCKMFRGVAASNLPVGSVKFDDGTGKFLKWDGSVWADLAATYDINVTRVSGNTVDKLAVKNVAGKFPIDITGDAGTVGGKKADSTAGNLVVLDGSAKVPAANLPALSGNATTLSGKSANSAAVNDTIPVRITVTDDTYPAGVVNLNSGLFTGNVRGNVGDAQHFGSLYGACMGGGYGANSGIYYQAVPGSYTWTAPAGVNKVFCAMWGGGAGGTPPTDLTISGAFGFGQQNGSWSGTSGGPTVFNGNTAAGGVAATLSRSNYVTTYTTGHAGAGGGALGGSQEPRDITLALLLQQLSMFGKVHGIGDTTWGASNIDPSGNVVDAAQHGNGGLWCDFVAVTPGQPYAVTIGAGYGGQPLTHGAIILVY